MIKAQREREREREKCERGRESEKERETEIERIWEILIENDSKNKWIWNKPFSLKRGW